MRIYQIFARRLNAKVKILDRIRNALDEEQVKLLHNSFILSQFDYCL